MNKTIFSKYPKINAAYGTTFGVIPPGLSGPAKAAAEALVKNAIESFNTLSDVGGVTEDALLPLVGPMHDHLACNIGFVTGWTAAKGY